MSEPNPISQADLDNLLSALAAGVNKEHSRNRDRQDKQIVHEARIYDFARAENLSREMLLSLDEVWSAFAQSTPLTLSGNLLRPVRFSLLSVEEVSYEQFVRSLLDPSVLAVFEMNPLPGRAMLEINPSIAFWIIDHLLGGVGEIIPTPRPLTAMENGLIEGLLEKLLEDFGAAWKSVGVVEPKLTKLISSAQGAQVAKPQENVLAISFELTIDSLVGMVNLCLPVILLKMAELERTMEEKGKLLEDPAAKHRELLAALGGVPFSCALSLGEVEVTLGELSVLDEGDILHLEKPIGDPLELLVGGIPMFACRPLTYKDKLAVELIEEVKKSPQGG
jgi:flagellar motor switch protein FliM